MNMPGFTAESSLCRTNGQYRTGRRAVHLPAQIISPIYPAVINVGHETIPIHSCLPGWNDWGGTCYPPLTEPPVGGGGEPGGSEPVEVGEGKGKPGKGKPGKDKPAPKRPVRRYLQSARNCLGTEAGPDLAKAELDCGAKSKGDDLRTLRCFDNSDGTVDAVCCHMDKKGKLTLCISDIEEVPK